MADNYEISAENFERYTYARDNGHIDFIEKADKCDKYFGGEQWDQLVKQRLNNQRKPALTINKTLATMATVFGEQIDSRAEVSFRPSNDGTAETADALDKVWLQTMNNNKFDRVESSVAEDGFVASRGFFDVRIAFNDSFQGEVRIKRINARNVVIDPDATEYDPDEWNEVFITKWLTYDDIALLYSKEAAQELEARGESNFFNGYDSVDRQHGSIGKLFRQGNMDPRRMDSRRVVRIIERQYRRLREVPHFIDTRTGDMRVVPENWEHNRISEVASLAGLEVIKRRAKVIRWTTTADTEVMFDDWSPYKHFTPVPFFPFFRNGKTIGLVENLLSLQDALNKAASQELHVINTTANSGWKVKTGALATMSIEELEARGAETGLVVELNDMDGIEKIQPNQIPTGLDRVSFKADNWIKEVSGVSDSQRGFDRADVAAKAIMAKQAAGSVNLTKPMDNLAYTRQMVAERALSLYQTYYTEERIIQVTGRTMGSKPEEITINQQSSAEGRVVNDLMLGEYSVVVTTVPSRKNFEESQFNQSVQMRELGVALPDWVLVENSFLANKAEVAEEMKKLAGLGEQTEIEQQMAQLEMQAKQVEIEKDQAEVEKKRADAALNAIRARKEAQEMMQGGDGGEAQKALADRESTMIETRMKYEESFERLRLEREKIEAEIQLKKEELELKRQEIAAKLAIQREESKAKIEVDKERADTDAETKRYTAEKQAETAKVVAKTKPTPKTGEK